MTRQANTLLMIIVSFLLAHWLRFGHTALDGQYLIALMLTLIISAILLPATGAYRKDFEWAVMRRIRRLIAGWAIVLLTLISTAAALKTTDYYSRIWFSTWALISTAGLVAIFLLAHVAAIRKRNRRRQLRPVALVGTGEVATRVETKIASDPSSDLTIAARFGDVDHGAGIKPISELAEYIAAHHIGEVWVAIPWEDKHTLDESLRALRESVVNVNVVPDLEQYRLLNQSISEWSGLPVISLAGTPMTAAEERIKKVFDWLFATFLLLLASPLFIAFSLIIAFSSPGPVFFRQIRNGLGGETIEIYKFRTMNVHKEKKGQLTQAVIGDERTTRIGQFLRRTSLDELPQLINVLKGEMSLVGPRPHAIEHNQFYKSRIPRYMLRHKVKPGITGWAQVNGYRGQTETKEKMALRIEHDLWYIQNWSLWLDLKILMMTPFVMMHRNAY